jgi:hypothetical protein
MLLVFKVCVQCNWCRYVKELNMEGATWSQDQYLSLLRTAGAAHAQSS